VNDRTWTDIKNFYNPTPPPLFCPAMSPADLIQNLATAYGALHLEHFVGLLANEPGAAAEFLFFLDGPGNELWGFTEEARIHQRMFEPQNTPPGQNPVPVEYWLVGIYISLTQSAEFRERTDLYESFTNPTGLSPTRWKVTDAVYATDVFFDTQDTDFQVTGRANFVVIEDLERQLGADGKFLLLQWNDLGTNAKATEATWSGVKSLYN
jgi:hypothetical protein